MSANFLETFWHSNIGVFQNKVLVLLFGCFVLKNILPVCDKSMEDLKDTSLNYFTVTVMNKKTTTKHRKPAVVSGPSKAHHKW